MKNLDPESQKAITTRAKSMLRAVRRRLHSTRDLGYALAAAKMVVTTLEAQARDSNLQQSVIDEGDRLSSDLETVLGLLS